MNKEKLLLFIVIFFAWGVWGILEKKILMYTNAGSYLFVYAIAQGVIGIPFYYFVFFKSKNQAFVVSKEMIILTIVLTVILAISYLAHAALLKNGAAGRVISMTAVYPVVTVLLSAMFFFKETMTPQSIGGVLFICAGLVLIY